MKTVIPLKERIIEEALKLFSVKGYMSTSTTDLIEAAHTSKGGFYNHFKSKEQLFHETLSTARKIWRERNLHGLEGERRPLDKLKLLLENYRDRYLADSLNFPGGCIFVNLAIELSDQAPALAGEVNEGFTRLKGMIRRLLDEEKRAGGIPASTDTGAVTELVFAGLLGACVMYTSDKSRKGLDSTIASLISYIDTHIS
ncbi:MAG TPA: TetR/AcrR family transcriptional regulator [Deltaproteobacteria bacterium]|jgi:TetR/AcrR family transcriptional repressor of nem operon|nr:TetR/AcrR family transcriptional regulator [Deltaproteobacteria bacterium]HOI08001.1 TetR/AcrR family transcriptional regulator [Deltaproteobacteria bacterium]